MNRAEELAGYGTSLHRLAHAAGSCDCDRPPPDPTDDRIALRLSFGRRAVAQARAAGVDMAEPTDEQLVELGDAEWNAYKEQVLIRLKAMNMAHRRAARRADQRSRNGDQRTAPRTSAQGRGSETPARSDPGGSRGVDTGQVDLSAHEVKVTPDRIEENDPLAILAEEQHEATENTHRQPVESWQDETNDPPDEEWSPL